MRNLSQILKYTIALILFSLLLSSCKSSKTSVETVPDHYFDGKVKFYKATDLTDAIDKATMEERPLFLEVYTDWCLPCKVISEEIFTVSEAASVFNNNFVNIKVDAEQAAGADLKLLYQINEIPTLLFLDHKGKVISRINGGVNYSNLMDSASYVLDSWEQASE